MSLKIKIAVIIVVIILLSGIGGYLFYTDSTNFDNKKQYKLAEKLYKEKNYQEAYAAFLKIRHYSKFSKAAVLKQAIAAEKLSDWAVAMNKYEAYLKKSKEDSFYAKAEYSYAKACYMSKEYDKAANAFLKLKKQSLVEDYRQAADYFLGKISLEKNMITTAKKYYLAYIKNAPTGTYAINIAFDSMNMVLSPQEAVLIAKIFLANQKYDEALVVLKDVPDAESWTYKAIAEYYKNNNDKFKKLVKDGLAKNCEKIARDDLRSFIDFYLSMQKDYQKALTDTQKTGAGKIIPDYFLYKKAQNMPQDEKINAYKNIVKQCPKSEYIPECLVDIFFDFADKKQYNAAIRTGEIYLQKFPDKIDEPQILFWIGKYLLKQHRSEEAQGYFARVKEKYPSSYYAFRASKIGSNQLLSWSFNKNLLPEKNKTDFPIKTVSETDIESVKMFLELGDETIWEEIPFDNLAIRAWIEYKKGNIQKSVYFANKFILETKEKIPYDDSVWKLAFPIYYAEDINKNAKMRKLDAFLVLSLMREESHFNPKARSTSNAVGLMQLMMPTAVNVAEKIGEEPPTDIKLQNPQYNITLGTAYIDFVLERTDKNPMYAVGAYNGGFNAMNQWREKYKNLDTDEFVEKIPYPESKHYIKKVFRSRYNYEKIYGK